MPLWRNDGQSRVDEDLRAHLRRAHLGMLFSLMAQQIVTTREFRIRAARYGTTEGMSLRRSRLVMGALMTGAIFGVQEPLLAVVAFVRPLRTLEMRLGVTSGHRLAGSLSSTSRPTAAGRGGFESRTETATTPSEHARS